MSESKRVICPIPSCGKLYQDWNGTVPIEQVERSFKSHLTGKHCLRGEAFKQAYKEAQRIGYVKVEVSV